MSLDLPAPLRPWAAELATWPLDLRNLLAPWLPRLALVVGPPAHPRERADGAPEGYAGLARRGSYERLLMSEWLLAEELPDEFLRRAAAGEHLFLNLARRRPAGNRRVVVLFDAGPEQLGAPRLAHLALLVVLAARARAAGIPLVFGVVQAPDAGLAAEVNPQSVRLLLAARTLAAPAPAHALAWRAHVATDGHDDLWLVGGAGLVGRGFPAHTSAIEIDEAVDAQVRALHVSVLRHGRPHGPVTLELPRATDAAQALVDPFAARAPQPAFTAWSMAPLRFAVNGNRLLVRTDDGVVSLGVPNKVGQKFGAGLIFRTPAGHTLVAADVHKRRITAVTIAPDGSWCLHGLTGARDFERPHVPPPVAEFVPPDPDGPLSPILLTPVDLDTRAYLVDARGQVFYLDLRGESRAQSMQLRALALVSVNRETLFIGFAADGSDAEQAGARFGKLTAQLTDQRAIGGSVDAAFAGHGRDWGPGPTIAARRPGGAWLLVGAATNAELHPPGHAEVCGAISAAVTNVGARPMLLMIDADRRSLIAMSREHAVTLAQEDQPILHACACGDLPRVAYQLADGTVVVRTTRGEQLVRHQLGKLR